MLKNKASVVAIVAVVIFAAMFSGREVEDEPLSVSQNVTSGEKDGLDFEIDLSDGIYDSLDSANIGWGFKKNKGAPPDIDEKTKTLFSSSNTFYIGRKKGVMYLTFDEGYENGYTASILDTLKEKNVKAAFFITGHYLKSEEELVRRMVDEGHIVGNHTLNHPNLAKSDLQTVRNELKSLEDEFANRIGANMKYMRPPEGEYSEKLLNFASDIGYKTILWSFAYRDWEANNVKGASYAFSQVTPYFHDGAILLLHAVSADNAAALGDIIDEARRLGYEFESIDTLE